MLQGRVYGMSGRESKRRAAELLERFGLADAAGRVVKTYSGGMQRKLDVAIGLVHQPQVLFLDEPTTGLDPEARVDMWDEIARLTQLERLTILLTTHYLEEADRLARRLAIVDRGHVVADGEPEQLKGELRGDAIVVELRGAADGRRGPPRAPGRPRRARHHARRPLAAGAGRQRRRPRSRPCSPRSRPRASRSRP